VEGDHHHPTLEMMDTEAVVVVVRPTLEIGETTRTATTTGIKAGDMVVVEEVVHINSKAISARTTIQNSVNT
jgi:hypothetical protein